MAGYVNLVAFLLGDRRYALHLRAVQRVVRAVEITLLPKAPEIVLGIINLRGKIIPALDMRRRFRLPEKETGLDDHFIIAATSRRTVALPVDSVEGVIGINEAEVTAAAAIFPGLEHVEGAVTLKDGMVLVHDLERFFSLDEETALDEALKEAR